MTEKTAAKSLVDEVQIENPDFYDENQFAIYDRMRTEAPAFFYAPLDIFVLTRMDDIRYVSSRPDLFSNTGGLTLNQLRMKKEGSDDSFERFNEPEGELVITKDPPRQRELRGLMSPTLTPRYLQKFQTALDRYCRELVDSVAEGEIFDFVDTIAEPLPLYIAAEILGVSEVDIPRMKTWMTALEELTRVETIADLEKPAEHFDEMKLFLAEQLNAKRVSPGDDMMSMFLTSRLNDEPVPDPIVISHVSTLMSNGGTTRLMLTSLANYLAENSELFYQIKNDPQLLDGAIEECLRLEPPARGFVRTATTDTELAGARVNSGQRVYMVYPAANRDPKYFDNPNAFNAHRKQAIGHVAFGFGAHFCLGNRLARMEAQALFREITSRFAEIRVRGQMSRYRHVQLNGLATLPVSFHR
ncbi:cytochrome P450 [Rhodococcus jostii]|uniref:Cytochrome P450 n=1 Tax=Rhodococcus jostii TaxID=132919 RepID=A0A1H4IMF0_RHOJO|nr:cytochrome P450 [Rhodococcus jostii]SEB35227.1 Cytochrome P450 [Rhodococcus jostii]